MLFDYINKLRDIDTKPRHPYKGELLQYVLVKPEETKHLETKSRYITTSYEKYDNFFLIHLYYNGKRMCGKRIMQTRPLLQEGVELINWLIMKIKMKEIK